MTSNWKYDSSVTDISLCSKRTLCAQIEESALVKHAGVTSKGRSEFVQEIQFQKLTPGSVIAFRYNSYCFFSFCDLLCIITAC